MKRNKIIKRLSIAFALTGIFAFGTVNSTSYTASAAVQSGNFNIDSVTGDYAVIKTNFPDQCPNQGTMGKPIHITTNVSGNTSGLTYTYSDSYKATAGSDSKTYGPYTSNSFDWYPRHSGLAVLTVYCTDGSSGVTKTSSVAVTFNQPLVINSFTGEYNNGDFEVQEKVSLGQPVKLKASISGGCYSGKINYTYNVIPRNASPENRSFTTTTQSPEFSWTPKYSGIYCVQLTVSDEIGNSANKDYYLLVQ